MQVSVDKEKCCGAGHCVLLNPQPAEQLHAAVREAAGMCPAAAIQLSEHA